MPVNKIDLYVHELAELYRWPDQGTLLVAISGGPDSTCAMRLMHEVALVKGFNLHFAHLDHCLRGSESAEDARFVEQLAHQYSWECTVKKVNIRQLHDEERGSLQQTCRLVRQDFLNHVASHVRAFGVVLGHNKGDQAETVLQHLIRGSGLAGLTGMSMIEKSETGLVTVRPLLGKTRSEVLEILEHYQMSYRRDPSNETDKYQRNHIRHHLIPFIEQHYNPQIVNRLADMADILREDEKFLESQSLKLAEKAVTKKQDAVVIDCNLLKNQSQSLAVRVMRYAYRLLRGSTENLTFEHSIKLLKLLDSRHGDRVSLPDNIDCEKIYGELYCYYKQIWDKALDKIENQTVSIDQEICLSEKLKLRVTLEDYPGTRTYFKSDLNEACFDYSQVELPLTVRSREDGDRFYPDGVPGSKKLKDFFIDRKIPKKLRDKCVLLVDNSGKILWIAGIRRSRYAKISQQTEKILVCRIMEGQ